MAKRYQIILTGKLLQGFNFNEIQGDVAQLFKIAPDKVTAFLSKPRVVKKDLDAEQTKRFRAKLEEIGLAIKIQPMAEEVPTVALETQPEKTIAKESPTLALDKQSNTTLAPKIETPKSHKPDIAELQTDEEDIYQLVRPVYPEDKYGIFHTWLEGMNRNSIIVGVIVLFIGVWLWAWMLLETMKQPLYAFVALAFVTGACVSKTGAKGIQSAIFCVLIFISSVIGGRIALQLYVFGDVDLWMAFTRFNTFSIIGLIVGSLAAFKGGLGYGRD